jgi:hypothetical protein
VTNNFFESLGVGIKMKNKTIATHFKLSIVKQEKPDDINITNTDLIKQLHLHPIKSPEIKAKTFPPSISNSGKLAYYNAKTNGNQKLGWITNIDGSKISSIIIDKHHQPPILQDDGSIILLNNIRNIIKKIDPNSNKTASIKSNFTSPFLKKTSNKTHYLIIEKKNNQKFIIIDNSLTKQYEASLKAPVFDPDISPDGKYINYIDKTTRKKITIINIHANKKQTISFNKGVYNPTWINKKVLFIFKSEEENEQLFYYDNSENIQHIKTPFIFDQPRYYDHNDVISLQNRYDHRQFAFYNNKLEAINREISFPENMYQPISFTHNKQNYLFFKSEKNEHNFWITDNQGNILDIKNNKPHIPFSKYILKT